MFKTLGHPEAGAARGARGAARAVIRFEGREIEARTGDNLAAVLLSAGEQVLRRAPVSGSPRGPYCMMGVCFECLLEINGVANRQACLVPVQPGMKIRSQEGARSHAA